MATTEAMDRLYHVADTMMSTETGRQRLADFFSKVDVSSQDADVMVGWLTATLPVKDSVPARKAYFEKVKQRLIELGESEADLLNGLQ